MSSWYTSWLPGLPSIDFALPSTIQRRFISFALKKSLGHLLKPGQLDVHQIESQIGSGYVQINNLELDNEAINSALTGLPLCLKDGTISAVTARIPWPNPLTSTLGFSVQSLHLTFHLVPVPPASLSASVPNLADSVASVAETFMHDELSPREEADLRQSIHPDLSSSIHDHGQHLPGSMDPFIHATDEEELRPDADPAGVSIFATLIENLLARFEFDASDTKITIVHPEHASLTLSVEQAQYRTESLQDTSGAADQGIADEIEQTSGETRKVSITGLSVTARDLRLPTPSSPKTFTPSTASPTTPNVPSRLPIDTRPARRSPSASPTSSSSSLDEDTQMMMSQSLAYLPPRHVPTSSSPTSSVASSMYESAISGRSRTPSPGDRGHSPEIGTTHSAWGNTPGTRAGEVVVEPHDETILSIAGEPIVISLTTPPVYASRDPSEDFPVPPESNEMASPPRNTDDVSDGQKLKLAITTGVLACAFRARHIRSILDMQDVWGTHQSPKKSAPSNAPSLPAASGGNVFALGLDVSVKIRGIVVIFLPASSPSPSLDDFFLRPLVPPRLGHGCVRIVLDTIETTCTLSTSSTPPTPSTSGAQKSQAPSSGSAFTMTLSLADVSAFALLAMPTSASADLEVVASPILITDQALSAQYPIAHTYPDPHAIYSDKGNYLPLPHFNVLDWTDRSHLPNSTKISAWRQKAHPVGSKRRESQTWVGPGHQSSSDKSSGVVEGDASPSHKITHSSALSVESKFTLASPVKRKGDKGNPPVNDFVIMNVVPLHIFGDLGLALSSSHALDFLDEILGGGSEPHLQSQEDRHGDGDDDDDDDDDHGVQGQDETGGKETERQRLERLVMEDLDLDIDYRQRGPGPTGGNQQHPKKPRKSKNTPVITVNLTMLRVQLRCPPPPRRAPRSGAVIIDLHGIQLSTDTDRKATTRFGDIDMQTPPRAASQQQRDTLLAVSCQRIAVANAVLGDHNAHVIMSLGSLSSMDDFGDLQHATSVPPLPLRIVVSQSQPTPTSTFGPSRTTTTAVTVDIPSVHGAISKALLDGIQLWADDVSQLVERTFGTSAGDTDTEKAESRNPSLIGSRFFAKSKRYGSRSSEESSIVNSETRTQTTSETVIKFAVTEAFIRLTLPRDDKESPTTRPFDIFASDIDALVELKPEGKDQTVMTLGVTDLNINDTDRSGNMTPYLALTTHRSMSTTPRPMLKLRFISLTVPETTAKETRVNLTLWGFTYHVYPDFKWVTDLALFAKAPPGAFESVIPSERTRLSIKVVEGSIRALAPSHPGAAVLYIGDLEFNTDIVGDSHESSFHLIVPSTNLLLVDELPKDGQSTKGTLPSVHQSSGISYWKGAGFALLADIADLDLRHKSNSAVKEGDIRVNIDRLGLKIYLCADTLHALTEFIGDWTSSFKPPIDTSVPIPKKRPTKISEQATTKHGIMASVDEHAFRKVPDVGSAPDMISDDLPANLDYLDASFGTAAGLRELRDDDLDEFDLEEAETGRTTPTLVEPQIGIISNVGGETIKMLRPLKIVENHFDTLPPDSANDNSLLGETTLRVRVHDCDLTLFLYDGYDWAHTRKTIEDEVKEMRRRLTKIRQLVANGQTQDPSVEDTSALLFNSVYIGLEQDMDELEPGALIAAIDEELNEVENESQSSWQSLRPPTAGKPQMRSTRVQGKRLSRSRGPSIEFKLSGLDAEVDNYRPEEAFVSRTFATVRDLEILDHIKTSTWQKFLTELRSDSRGNVRETESNMVRVELRTVRPVPSDPSEEARLRAKILPLRLYVDQDALDFLKKFFSFKDPRSEPSPTPESSDGGIYFQHAEVFPVDIKLDYKPRRVDYRALREGKTIELMNFFHFDGSEMTLRHITLHGITGWPRFFDMLNDLWTPDVKATQLVDVISGVSPIRSVVNVGSGVADLVLLPIAQYKKDGRIVRGMQKGTTAFFKSTAMEAIKLSAKLATGTQVILEQAEHVLGGQFSDSITAETLQFPDDFVGPADIQSGDDEDPADLISKYAEQPLDVREGMQSAYKSLQKNLNSAAQTILAVPMEVYERSGNEGAVRSVIRAVPIAVLKPMIGATEAVSKTLMGLQNTMDPNIRQENKDKYKHR